MIMNYVRNANPSVARFKQVDTITPQVIAETFPTIVHIGTQLLDSPPAPLTPSSPEIPSFLHLILKIYKSTLVSALSAHQQSNESIIPWGNLLFSVVNVRIPHPPSSSSAASSQQAQQQHATDAAAAAASPLSPAHASSASTSAPSPSTLTAHNHTEWWKAKKWAYGTLARLFHKFGSPSQLPSVMHQYLPFAEHFVATFAPEIIKTYLEQLSLYAAGQVWLSEKCLYLVFQFLTEW